MISRSSTLAIVFPLGCALLLAGCNGCGAAGADGGEPFSSVDLEQGHACRTDDDCRRLLAPLPRCQPGTGRCVACLSDDACRLGEVCDRYLGDCTPGCSATHGCASGVCDTEGGLCVACLTGGDCAAGATGRPYCDPASHACVACLSSDDHCPRGSFCRGGHCSSGCRDDSDCEPAAPRCVGNGCFECAGDADCPLGTVCTVGQCRPGCLGRGCPVGQSCCRDRCVDLASDPDHCGSCEVACPFAPMACCLGACLDLTSDDTACGGCDQPCAAGSHCAASQCGLPAPDGG